jgi:hypothetical protein
MSDDSFQIRGCSVTFSDLRCREEETPNGISAQNGEQTQQSGNGIMHQDQKID